MAQLWEQQITLAGRLSQFFLPEILSLAYHHFCSAPLPVGTNKPPPRKAGISNLTEQQPLPSLRPRSRTRTLISAPSFRGYFSPSPLNLLHRIAADRTRRPTPQEQFRTLCSRTNHSSRHPSFCPLPIPFYVPHTTLK